MMRFVSSTINQLTNLASFSSDLAPIIASLVGLATVVATVFIIIGGLQYITSSGNPDKLVRAKKVIRGAIIGLVIVLAAGTLVGFLHQAYQEPTGSDFVQLAPLTEISDESGRGGIAELLIKALVGLFSHIIETAAIPFIAALEYFTRATPLMADNPAVFKLWLVVAGIANSLLVLVIILIGFQMMSASSLGLEEVSLRQLLPKLAAVFLLINTSIFAIDGLITISNLMIKALYGLSPSNALWHSLSQLMETASAAGIVALLIMLVFMILTVILLVYYVMRLVGLYLGAVLSPLVVLLQLVPGFRDFTATAARVYFVNVFVLFVHGVIMLLAGSLFIGLRDQGSAAVESVMAMILGVATLISLLKTQGLMQQMTYVSVGPKALRKLGHQFINGVSALSSKLGRPAPVKPTYVRKTP